MEDVEVVIPDAESYPEILEQVHEVEAVDEEEPEEVVEEPVVELTPLEEILSIFPDAKASFVTQLLGKYGNTPLTLEEMMTKGYEKDEKKKIVVAKDYDFDSTSSFVCSELYCANAYTKLQNDFPFLMGKGLKAVLTEKKFHYLPTLKSLEATLGVKAQFFPLETKLHNKLFQALSPDQKKFINSRLVGTPLALKATYK